MNSLLISSSHTIQLLAAAGEARRAHRSRLARVHLHNHEQVWKGANEEGRGGRGGAVLFCSHRKGTHEACSVTGDVHTEQGDVRVAKKAYYCWRKFGKQVHMENQDARTEGPELEHSDFITVQPGTGEPGRAPLHVQGQNRGHRAPREPRVQSSRPRLRLKRGNQSAPAENPTWRRVRVRARIGQGGE